MITLMLVLSMQMNLESWWAVNDGVMGGVSAGRMSATADGLVFEGVLSLENNGGFASVRSMIEEDVSEADRIQIRVRGDGRTYQARFRQGNSFDGVAWRSEFETTGKWQTIELEFNKFEPVFRGRKVPQAGPLNAREIRQMGFLLADYTPGPFRLEIAAIEFMADSAPAQNP